MKLVITMTTEQFERRWHFLRHWLPTQQRKEAITWFEKNKDKINENTKLEITTQRD